MTFAQLTLKKVQDNYFGCFVRFTIKKIPGFYYGKLIANKLNPINNKGRTLTALVFQVIEDLEAYRKNKAKYKFTHLTVHEGEIEDIELWENG